MLTISRTSSERLIDTSPVTLDHAHAASSDHRPMTWAQLGYDDSGLHVRFRVEDRYVIAKRTVAQSSVWRDSCVEFFIIPGRGEGYVNFEFNCIGTMLVHWNNEGSHEALPAERLKKIAVTTSLAGPIPVEIPDPVNWWLTASISWDFFDFIPGFKVPVSGDAWRGNLFKCAGDSSHPHYLSWQSIGPIKLFHQTQFFATMRFE